MMHIIDKSLKKLPYISTAKAGSFTATFGKKIGILRIPILNYLALN